MNKSEPEAQCATKDSNESDPKSAEYAQGTEVNPGYFTNIYFKDFELCEPILKGLAEMKFERTTEIQAKCIPPMLLGKDVLGKAKTGSGKTLAFLLPLAEILYQVKFIPRNGTGGLIISPTRELCLQIFEVAQDVLKHVPQTIGIVMGGANRKFEAEKLTRGVNILIATPGRLLDHMNSTQGFVYKNLLVFVIDEADRILEIGFEEEMNQIIKKLPEKRQTALFSATYSNNVQDLVRLSMQSPVFLQASSDDIATVSTLEQGYVVCEAENRFMLLFTFLKKNLDKKIMVFFSSCNSVKFHDDLLNYIDIPTTSIHGKKKQTARVATFRSFCLAKKGHLLCTDVAARGLDIPKVDWIVQYDPPDDPRDYIHRVGRTARGADGHGRAILFLMPEELGFLHYLKQLKVTLNKYEFDMSKIAQVQVQLEKLIERNRHLNVASREAYKSYLHAYISHSQKNIFNVHALDLGRVARAFGFSTPPKVDLNIKPSNRTQKRLAKAQHADWRHDKGTKRLRSPGDDPRQFDRRYEQFGVGGVCVGRN
ncbi:bifunctional Helicase superfamily 1-2 [Babesia duncani]|uniref:ATP-dependent RNA helicase n=1 Tax=Babesia duncani TaxID=323732 RepID=A0AAD9PL31_9APIC|nr:bifunctional Helicase superfamily 1-2 [Babesia duncani]